ncbi:MAG: cysteine hydrolase [Acidobacteriota bacterium]|nr:MAG: cysteine hydrolase [Acidobacteriota bacterium]
MLFIDVDTQRDFMDPDGALYVPGAVEIKDNIERLLRAAAERGITTISTRCAHDPNDAEFEIFPPHCVKGTPGAERIFPDLPALPRHEIPTDAAAVPGATLEQGAHYVISKKVFDPFSNAWLGGLREEGAFRDEDCILFGVATDYCVIAGGLGLAGGGAHFKVVEDAIRGVAPETTADALDQLRLAGAEFISTEEVLARLDQS